MDTPLQAVTSDQPNPLEQLHELGQSVWYDNISRDLLEGGRLQKLINTRGVLGVTSNPTIFAKAIAESSLYDPEVREGLQRGDDAITVFNRLAVTDIQATADLLHPVYDRTAAYDGYISLEVSPTLAHDTDGTVAEAQRLWGLVARPNLMIKVPATLAGLPAITQLIAAGINVNVTLIFGLERYEAVMEAYLTGLEQRVAADGPVARVASVASFFVSRVDSLVDKRLQAQIDGNAGDANALKALLGKAAIANAKLAYALFQRTFSGPRWEALQEHGAQVQRPLWASTSTKNPNYRDVIYVEELIGKDTVNTMPPPTVEAFADHGVVAETVTTGVDEAGRVFDQLREVGIEMDEVTAQLEAEGVKSFADSFNQMLATIDGKRAVVSEQIAQ